MKIKTWKVRVWQAICLLAFVFLLAASDHWLQHHGGRVNWVFARSMETACILFLITLGFGQDKTFLDCTRCEDEGKYNEEYYARLAEEAGR